jgi:SAM-dependent methyltransferase
MNKLVRPYNWLIFRLVEPALAEALSAHAKGRLLDIGAGEKPWAELAQPFVTEHVAVDHDESPHPKQDLDLVGSAYELPAEDAAFDTVLCSYVLEHLEEPGRALAEAWRVLAPGGAAIYTVPHIWHLHEEPRDFYRFTKYGLAYLFEQAGFEVVEIRPICGFPATFAQQLAYFAWGFAPRSAANPLRWLVHGFVWGVQHLGLALDGIDRSEKYPAEYLAVARKPAG